METTQTLHEARETLDVHLILLSNVVSILFRVFAVEASAVEDFHEKVMEHGGAGGAETFVVVGWVDVAAEGLSLFDRKGG